MIKQQNKKLNIVIAAVLFAVGIVIACAYTYGDDIRADEVFSLGFANNTRDFLFLTRSVCDSYSTDGWLSGEFIKEYFAVEPGEQFAIMSIHRNVRNDVHPPLFFMVLNAVSSFWAGQYTAVPGHIINIILAAVMLVFLYLTGRKILTNRWAAVLIPIVWISSTGAAESVNYIRMYLALCVITVITVYLSMFLIEEKYSRWSYLLMGLCVTIGTLLHYYFYIMCFFVIVYVSIWHIKHKQYKRLGLYYICLAIGELVSLAAYPYAIKHMLYSDRGEQVQEHLASADSNFYIEHIKGFADTFNTEVFSGYAIVCLVIIAAALLLRIVLLKDRKQHVFCEGYGKRVGLVASVAAGYFIVLFKISYSYKWTYVSLTFALIDILLICLLAYIGEMLGAKGGMLAVCAGVIILSAVAMYGSVNESVEKHNNYIVREDMLNKRVEDNPVIFVYSVWADTLDSQASTLINSSYIKFVSAEELADIDWKRTMEECPDDDGDIILYLSSDISEIEKVVSNCCDSLGIEQSSCIWKDNYTIMYLQRE